MQHYQHPINGVQQMPQMPSGIYHNSQDMSQASMPSQQNHPSAFPQNHNLGMC